MYNAPRAASIACKKPGKLYKLDRITFSQIVKQASFKKREMYKRVIDQIEVFNSINTVEKYIFAYLDNNFWIFWRRRGMRKVSMWSNKENRVTSFTSSSRVNLLRKRLRLPMSCPELSTSTRLVNTLENLLYCMMFRGRQVWRLWLLLESRSLTGKASRESSDPWKTSWRETRRNTAWRLRSWSVHDFTKLSFLNTSQQ